MGKEGGLSGVVAAAGAVAAMGWLAVRTARRANAGVVRCKFQCKCGKVHGSVSAIKEDANPIDCYCNSCREYGLWAAERAKEQGFSHCVVKEDGGSYIVQLCKSDIHLDGGIEHLKLAMLNPKTMTKRFYAACCGTPMFNTAETVGFIGLLADNLDEKKIEFGEPAVLFPESAPGPIPNFDSRPKAKLTTAIWNVIRFIPDSASGPALDYKQTPTYIRKKKADH